jgi:hypothetical protein
LDEAAGKWVALETSVEQDLVSGKWYAVVKVNHLTRFAVFSTAAGQPFKPVKVIKLTIGQVAAVVDGKSYTLDAVPYVDSMANRTLVPIRFISEALGAEVDWQAATRQLVIKDGDQEIVLTIGSTNALVDGQTTALDCAPETKPPGRTFVPLRFVSETLGARVDWEAVTNTITITR